MGYIQEQFGEDAEAILGRHTVGKINFLHETLFTNNLIDENAPLGDVLDKAMECEILEREEKQAIKSKIQNTYELKI